MQVEGKKLRRGLLVYRGVLFDYINGRTYGPCFTMKQEAIEWAEREAQKSARPIDVQKSVMWNTCDTEGVEPDIDGSKSDTII
ncbi:hypothetical protein KAI46_03070 [bacterium]|nr:hypothetical protein [bacterium]